MAENSNIEWTDHTFNPWLGCQKVSPACDNCYAEVTTARFNMVEWGPHAPRKRTSLANWSKVRTWNRKAGANGVRERVFVASLADVFDNHKSIAQEWRDDLWALIRACPNLDFLLLTKRPQNIHRYVPDDWGDGYPNVWLGTTVEDQDSADQRIPKLLETPARTRFLSCEPLLGPIQLSTGHTDYLKGWSTEPECCGQPEVYYGEGPDGYPEPIGEDCCGCPHPSQVQTHAIDWVICGGESGQGARPMHPRWALDLQRQCEASGTPFFFKQWGEWLPWFYFMDASIPDDDEQTRYKTAIWWDGEWDYIGHPGWWNVKDDYGGGANHISEPDQIMGRVGKKRAGRSLEGKQYSQYPEIAA